MKYGYILKIFILKNTREIFRKTASVIRKQNVREIRDKMLEKSVDFLEQSSNFSG